MAERCNLCGGHENSILHQDYTHWVRSITIRMYIAIYVAMHIKFMHKAYFNSFTYIGAM